MSILTKGEFIGAEFSLSKPVARIRKLPNQPFGKSMSTRFSLACFSLSCLALLASDHLGAAQQGYVWTTDHLHVGVRWQPFGLKKCEEYDANRPLLNEHSSYAQFWVSWRAAEPTEKNVDYKNHLSGYLRAIDHAVNLCVKRGVHVELVTWHCPPRASELGQGGGHRRSK